MGEDFANGISRVADLGEQHRRDAAKGAVWMLVTDDSTPEQLREARGLLEALGLAEPRGKPGRRHNPLTGCWTKT